MSCRLLPCCRLLSLTTAFATILNTHPHSRGQGYSEVVPQPIVITLPLIFIRSDSCNDCSKRDRNTAHWKSMISPVRSQVIQSSGLRMADFTLDTPHPRSAGGGPREASHAPGLIDGLTVTPLAVNIDKRGSLSELLTTRDGLIEPIVHIYQVAAAPGSVRAWVYHRFQYDRLAYTSGRFEVVLYDLREGSPTINLLNVFLLGKEQPCLLRIPPLVIHGVRNTGSQWESFVNMPTKAYDPTNPDKYRLPQDDPKIPFKFEY
jgi:dTDP-4-dehydrorhamnose 3,5-epimerase